MSLMSRQIMLCVEESSSGQRYLKICFQIWTHSSSHIPPCYRMSLTNGIPASVVGSSMFVTGLCSPSTRMTSCSYCFSFRWELPVFPGVLSFIHSKPDIPCETPFVRMWLNPSQFLHGVLGPQRLVWSYRHITRSSGEKGGFLGKWADGLSFPTELTCRGWNYFIRFSGTRGLRLKSTE